MGDTNVGEGRRVAVVGAGPSGFYATEQLLGLGFAVDLYDQLPTPFGLVRFGVAPDHPKIKSVTRMYEKTARKDGFRFFGGVAIGDDISCAELRERYHAVLYATGTASDNRLGIPGEDRPGSYAATRFVAWYNGHPDACDDEFDLSATRAVVVGNGNVAIDIARMLVLDPDELAPTDTADHALAALAASQVEEVILLGRRGPAQAAFTNPELRELGELSRAAPVVDPGELELDDASRTWLETEAVPTNREEVIPCGLVIRSIGYRGVPFGDIPFDERRGLIRNVGGRVCEQDGTLQPGQYAVGWIKRGPSGVIGANKKCAAEATAVIAEDAAAGALPEPAADATLEWVRERAPHAVDWEGWQAIDEHEKRLGEESGRPRVKLVTADDLRAASRGALAR